MELNIEQTIHLKINVKKQDSFASRYKFKTKYQWWCLNCLSVIYVSYKQYGRNSIFCNLCEAKMEKKPSIVQYQYMRVLKEKQMNLIDNLISKQCL